MQTVSQVHVRPPSITPVRMFVCATRKQNMHINKGKIATVIPIKNGIELPQHGAPSVRNSSASAYCCRRQQVATHVLNLLATSTFCALFDWQATFHASKQQSRSNETGTMCPKSISCPRSNIEYGLVSATSSAQLFVIQSF